MNDLEFWLTDTSKEAPPSSSAVKPATQERLPAKEEKEDEEGETRKSKKSGKAKKVRSVSLKYWLLLACNCISIGHWRMWRGL